jgi:hypothetical protein
MPQDLFTNIFGASADDNTSMLRQVTNDFPYFSIAQFYLLKQTDPSDPDHLSIAGKTALHFNNPFHLNYLLNKKDSEELTTDPHSKTVAETNISAMQEAAQTEKEAAEPMIFEPLYTTDYFASQGIRLSDEIKPDDKLGKQLKSFTDWLKTMKKVHDQKLPAGNEQLDLSVQNIAEKSNKESDILTESMAEVYISQGKYRKALEIYEKLSLLNPSKSAYFAAKTEHLKDK